VEVAGGDVTSLELKRVKRAAFITCFQLLNQTADTRLLYGHGLHGTFAGTFAGSCSQSAGKSLEKVLRKAHATEFDMITWQPSN